MEAPKKYLSKLSPDDVQKLIEQHIARDTDDVPLVLENVHLKNIRLPRGVPIRNLHIIGSIIEQGKFTGISFVGLSIKDSIVKESDFSWAKFTSSYIKNTEFSHTQFGSATFAGTAFRSTSFNNFSGLIGAKFIAGSILQNSAHDGTLGISYAILPHTTLRMGNNHVVWFGNLLAINQQQATFNAWDTMPSEKLRLMFPVPGEWELIRTTIKNVQEFYDKNTSKGE